MNFNPWKGKILVIFLIATMILGGAESDVIISNTSIITGNGISASITYNNSTPYIPIKIWNNQSYSTPKNFQMLLNVNWQKFQQYLNENVSNVRFYSSISAIGSLYGNEVLPAWIESNNSSHALSSNVWVNMSSVQIKANGETTIFMAFLSRTVDWSQYWGINSYLDPSSKFGYADNGRNVFLFYDNGNSLMPVKQTGTQGKGPSVVINAPAPYEYAISGSVNNGNANADTWTSNGIVVASSPSLNLPDSYIAQIRVYLTGSSPLTDLLTNVNSISSGNFYVFRLDHRNVAPNEYDLIGYYPYGATSTQILNYSGDHVTGVDQWYQLSAIDGNDTLSLYKSSSNNLYLDGYGTLEERSKGMGYAGGGIAVTTDGASSTDYWTTIIVRNYPPDGVMPSYTFESLDGIYAGQSTHSARISPSETNATMILQSTWGVDIYSDDQGNIFWTDSSGNVFVDFASTNQITELPSVREKFPNVGEVTSIAAMNYSNGGTLVSYVVLLTLSGCAYIYNMQNGTWFNVSALWTNDPLNFGAGPWTSVTTNVGAGPAGKEYFFFTAYDGLLLSLDPRRGGSGQWGIINSKLSSYNFISTVGFSSANGQSNGFVYALTSGGNVYYAQYPGKHSWKPYFTGNLTGAIGITIGYGVNFTQRLHILKYQIDSPIYEGPSLTGNGLKSGSFTPTGPPPFPDGHGTAITFDINTSSPIYFAALSVNGTVALSYNGIASWTCLDSSKFGYIYQALYINSTLSQNFSAYALYINSTNSSSINTLSLYFISNGTQLEFRQYPNGSMINPHIPANLDSNQSILITIQFEINSFNDSYYHFKLILYPGNISNSENSVVIIYNMYIEIINSYPFAAVF